MTRDGYCVELDGTSSSLMIKPCNILPTVCVVWLYVACCFHMCGQYQGSLDVIVLLQASPEKKTKKQQEDADRAMERNHEKNLQGEQEPKERDGNEASRELAVAQERKSGSGKAMTG